MMITMQPLQPQRDPSRCRWVSDMRSRVSLSVIMPARDDERRDDLAKRRRQLRAL